MPVTVESTSSQGNNGIVVEIAPMSSRNPAEVRSNGYMQKQNNKHFPRINIYLKSAKV